MAVIHLRVDNRLIHGQVTVTWAQSVGTNYIVVANDKVAADPIQKMILPQAARGVPTKVLSIEETLKFVDTPEGQRAKIMVIAKTAADALALLEGGIKPQEVNVGNQAPVQGTKYKMVMRSVAVTAEDAVTYRAIAAKGFKITSKMMPSDRANDFVELIGKNGL